MKAVLIRYRRFIVVFLHLGLCLVSNYLAFLLRFDNGVPPEHIRPLILALPWLIAIRGTSFWVFRLYHGLWRYASLWDLQRIIGSVVVSSVVFALVVRGLLNLTPYPRSIFVLDAIVLILLLGGVRLARRVYREFDRLNTERRVLIFGAGDAGEMIVRDMKNNRFYNWEPIGFIDDDPAKVGQTIHGVRVLGTRAALPRVIEAHAPQEVLVAIPRARPAELRSVVQSLERFKIPIKTLPNLRDVLDGRLTVNQIRNLALEDLIPREPLGLGMERVQELIRGRCVLVTGAGGSIGSELSRQVARLGPVRLLVCERHENSLFELCAELTSLVPGLQLEPLLTDVTDPTRVDAMFRQHRPHLVFHAAAHKHVPIVELNPCEGVRNNVHGSRILAEAAVRHGARKFVLISSDKAVNPSSVMGATKRVAEFMVTDMNRHEVTHFAAVRFGNVLGSSGSVTRIFAAQIARGGPVTVTHPDMRRFFMLIPEAVHLVLHAAAMEDTGIYALDMGDQIRIVDLARNLIRLSGCLPDEEIAIQFTGLRPGEKLYEELVENGEAAAPSDVEKVLKVTPRSMPDNLWALVADLEAAAHLGRNEQVRRLLASIVPTFKGVETPGAVERPRLVAG